MRAWRSDRISASIWIENGVTCRGELISGLVLVRRHATTVEYRSVEEWQNKRGQQRQANQEELDVDVDDWNDKKHDECEQARRGGCDECSENWAFSIQ